MFIIIAAVIAISVIIGTIVRAERKLEIDYRRTEMLINLKFDIALARMQTA